MNNQKILEFGSPHKDSQYRKSVGAVILHPTDNKVLALDWRIYPVYGIVQGGLENDESETSALRRELTEETGFTDFQIISKLGENIISYFFADTKNVWRKLELACYLVKLNSLTQIERQLESNENFDLKWVDIDDFIKLVEEHKPTKSQDFRALGEFLKRAKSLDNQN